MTAVRLDTSLLTFMQKHIREGQANKQLQTAASLGMPLSPLYGHLYRDMLQVYGLCQFNIRVD